MKNTKFNWECAHCSNRNIEIIKFQFDVPKDYEAQWACSKCGKETKIIFSFSVEAVYK